MDNFTILRLLERQRDSLYEGLKTKSVSGMFREQYDDIKTGKVVIPGDDKEQMLSDLKKLSGNTSLDNDFTNKLTEYAQLDNTSLTAYFQNEFERVFNEIMSSGKQDQIQAMFIEYDDYYEFSGSIMCYGQQVYPLIEEPRYISDEFDYNKEILFIENGINFKPAWADCEVFSDLDYIEIGFELERLFQLHSRTLLHKALENLKISGKLQFLQNRPFSFYINEHDCEVMMLYRVN